MNNFTVRNTQCDIGWFYPNTTYMAAQDLIIESCMCTGNIWSNEDMKYIILFVEISSVN